MNYRKFFVVFLLSIVTAGVTNAASVKSDNNKIKLDIKGNYFAVKGLGESFQSRGKFFIYDGKDKKYIDMQNAVVSEENNIVTLKYSDSGIVWVLSFIPKAEMILIDSNISNKTNKEQWLEPGIVLDLNKAGSIKRAWDGWGVDYEFGSKIIGHKGIKGPVEKHVGASSRPFPVAAVYSDDKALFIGGVPFEPVSYEAASIGPLNNGKSSMQYSIRTALFPQKTENIKFVIGAANAEFGGKEAVVQSYYDSLPEIWAPAVGEGNPYLWGQHGEYANWKGKPNPEKTRRLYIVNEWTYCPYKRSGDVACKAELWNYKPLGRTNSPMILGRRIDFNKISREDYLTFRRKVFQEYAQKYGLMFYLTVAGTWCEIQLAEKYYPDAIVKDKDVKCFLQSWSTARDHEVRIFPMGTSFAKVLLEDIKYLVKELDLPGFAFDCSYGGAYYRGPAVKKDLPGRAWDSKGVFIDQSVAINSLVDYIHSLKPVSNNEKKLFVFANGYLKGDYMMMEKPFLGVGTYKRWFPLLKYYIGPRPATTHGHGYLFKETIPSWREKTSADFKEIMPKLVDYIIFNCFKYGTFSSSYTINYGVPQTVYILPELIEVVRAGWQAEIPLELDSQGKIIYKARYGKGINSYLFLGNPYPQESTINVKLDCSYLGDQDNLIIRKMRKSAKTRFAVGNRKLELNIKLRSRIPYLYETICGISPSKVNYKCEVSSEKDLNRQQYSIKFESGKNFRAKLYFRKIRNFVLNKVSVDGKAVPVENDVAAIDINQGTVVNIIYKSDSFELTEKELLAFPFVDSAQKVNFKIAVPQEPGTEEMKAAEMLKEYFAFCAETSIIDRKSPEVDIVRSNSIPAEGNWIVIAQKSGNSIRINGKNLYIQGRKLKDLVKAVEYAMDKKFHYSFPFKGTMGLYDYQLKHFKMLGKTLPYLKYFENSANGN